MMYVGGKRLRRLQHVKGHLESSRQGWPSEANAKILTRAHAQHFLLKRGAGEAAGEARVVLVFITVHHRAYQSKTVNFLFQKPLVAKCSRW
jgi:hypothetical protein